MELNVSAQQVHAAADISRRSALIASNACNIIICSQQKTVNNYSHQRTSMDNLTRLEHDASTANLNGEFEKFNITDSTTELIHKFEDLIK